MDNPVWTVIVNATTVRRSTDGVPLGGMVLSSPKPTPTPTKSPTPLPTPLMREDRDTEGGETK